MFGQRRPEHEPVAFLIYVASAIGLLGTAAMSPVLPIIMFEFDLTETEISLMMTLFTLPVVFFVPIIGWVADRIGRRPVLTFSLFLFGIAGGVIYFVNDFYVILGLRILQGIGFSGIIPLVVVIVGDLFDGADEVGAQGMRVTFVNLGAFIFPIATGILVGIAWNVPFLLFFIAVPAGVFILRWMPEPAAFDSKPKHYARKVLGIVHNRLIASAMIVGSLRFFIIYGLYTFLPVLVVKNDITIGEAGLIIGTLNAAKMVIASQSRRSLILGTPQRTMVVGLLIAMGTVAVFILADTLVAFLLVAIVFGCTDGLIAPLQKSVLTQNTPQQFRAGVISLNAVFQNVAKTLAPISLGLLITMIGIQNVFLVVSTGGVSIAAILFVSLLPQMSKQPDIH